ncbi:MAG: hypothetical protein D3904_10560, partial [Candidatus Electrothrix sp. EH2]|nr:hypothetical protein [Candidatus Electrothrix sp. EH2]
MNFLSLFCCVLVLCTASPLSAHKLYLKNGHVITTDNVWREGDTVHYEQYGGTISIPYSRVKGVAYTTPPEEKGDGPAQAAEEDTAGQGQRLIPPDKDLAAKLR